MRSRTRAAASQGPCSRDVGPPLCPLGLRLKLAHDDGASRGPPSPRRSPPRHGAEKPLVTYAHLSETRLVWAGCCRLCRNANAKGWLGRSSVEQKPTLPRTSQKLRLCVFAWVFALALCHKQPAVRGSFAGCAIIVSDAGLPDTRLLCCLLSQCGGPAEPGPGAGRGQKRFRSRRPPPVFAGDGEEPAGLLGREPLVSSLPLVMPCTRGSWCGRPEGLPCLDASTEQRREGGPAGRCRDTLRPPPQTEGHTAPVSLPQKTV